MIVDYIGEKRVICCRLLFVSGVVLSEDAAAGGATGVIDVESGGSVFEFRLLVRPAVTDVNTPSNPPPPGGDSGDSNDTIVETFRYANCEFKSIVDHIS